MAPLLSPSGTLSPLRISIVLVSITFHGFSQEIETTGVRPARWCAGMIDEGWCGWAKDVTHEWLSLDGSKSWPEVKWMGGVTRPGFTEGGATYIDRGCHLEYNVSCLNARNICLGLWWHNTPCPYSPLAPPSPLKWCPVWPSHHPAPAPVPHAC